MTTPTFGPPNDDRDGIPDDEQRPGATASPYRSSPPPPNLPPPVYGEVQHQSYPGDRIPQPGPAQYAHPSLYMQPTAPVSNGVATAGGVCGIVAASISWVPILNFFSIILSIIAIALGAVGWKRANTLQRDVGRPIGRGMAITGVVIGTVGLALALLLIAALGSALSQVGNT